MAAVTNPALEYLQALQAAQQQLAQFTGGIFGRSPSAADKLDTRERLADLDAARNRRQLAQDTQGMVPGAQQGLLIAAGQQGFDKSSGALGGIREAMGRATTPEQLNQTLGNAGAVITDPRFSTVPRAARDAAQELAASKFDEQAAKTKKARHEAWLKQQEVDAYDIEAAVAGNTAAKLAAQREMVKERAHAAGVAVPEIGQRALTSPLTGQPVIAAMPGTEEYNKAWHQVQGGIEALRLYNRITDDIKQAGTSGTDFIGNRAARVDGNRAKLFSAIFQARGLGAPQGPDVELVERGLPDSTGIMANLRGMFTGGAGGQKSSILQGYQTIAEEMQQIVTDQLVMNPMLIDELMDSDIGQLHPSSDLFQLLVKLKGM